MKRPPLIASLVAVIVLVAGPGGRAQASRATLIRNAIVLDGSGAPGRHADVRIVGDRISDIGSLRPAADDTVVDADGLVLAPGFIDTHSHHDRGIFDHRDALAAISQGITTIVVGQDGTSALPLADFFERLAASAPAVNVASYVGHGSVRHAVLGDDFRRAATVDEIGRMRNLIEREMRAGALGLSTGLEYDPGIYSTHDEVVELTRAVAPFGGRYISHIRSEDRELWAAIDEVIDIGRTARIPV